MGGKVLVPTSTAVRNLKAARLAADIADVPLIILARTDANAAKLITNDHDENDKPFFCLLYTSPSPRDVRSSRMPSSA